MRRYTQIPKRFNSWREARLIAGPLLQKKREIRNRMRNEGGWFIITYYKKDGHHEQMIATLDPSLHRPYVRTTNRPPRPETINLSVWAKISSGRVVNYWRSFIVENLISIEHE